MQAFSKLSIRSENDQQEDSKAGKGNIFSNIKMKMPTQDDGGIGANLVSMDQMAKNLVREKEPASKTAKKRDEANTSDMLDKLDKLSSVSPDPGRLEKEGVIFSENKVERPSVRNKPFDLSN